MTPGVVVLIGIAIAASVSRILTLLTLWQVKEWRWDRLKEHLRSEGWGRQLVGTIEPSIIAIALIISTFNVVSHILITLIGLIALAALSALRIVFHLQRRPVWTQKAVVFFLSTLIMNGVIAVLSVLWLPLPIIVILPLIQPILVMLAWLLFKPIDSYLKQRILTRAATIRKKFPELTVIGIAGSVGKTTTKEILAHIVQSDGTRATPEHINSELGVAKWLTDTLSADDAVSINTLIIEMGAYRKGEIALLCEIAKPQYGIVTYLGQDHLALFGSEEAIRDANGELLQALPEDGHAFINADSAYTEELIALCNCPVTTVGSGGDGDMQSSDVVETADGIEFNVEEQRCRIPLHGTHNVTNVLLAIATAKTIGMNMQTIVQRCASFVPMQHTFEVRTERGITILDDTYNASPQSFRAAIEWARTQPFDTKVLLTSGVIELGEEEDNIHTGLGALCRNVFHEVYILNKKFVQPFAQGFGEEHVYESQDNVALKEKTLLVCIGRMSPAAITRMLP